MTKTLTEQWREGKLPEGYYYTKLNDDNGTIEINYCWDDGCFQDYCDNMVKEVLAPVPSYERAKDLDRLEQFCELLLVGEKQEWESIVKRGNRKEMAKWLNERKNETIERIEKQLSIATKALKEYANQDKWSYCSEDIDYFYSTKPGYRDAEKALEEMEGVK